MRHHKNKEIIYEQQKRKGYGQNQKTLKIEEENDEMAIDTITKSSHIDKSSEHVIILQTEDAEKTYDELLIQ